VKYEVVDNAAAHNFRNNLKKQPSFRKVNIKMVYKINEQLKYPTDDALWYIFHVEAKSSFGPISSKHLEEIYNSKNIDGNSEIRLIDIFKIKNKGAFAYFQLIDIENPMFLKNTIEPSSLIRYTEELKKNQNCGK